MKKQIPNGKYSKSNHMEFKNIVDSLNLKFPIADISRKTGHSKGNISNFYNNKKQLTRSFLIDFCKAYGLDYKSLFADEEEGGDSVNIEQPKEEDYKAKYYEEKDKRIALLEHNQKSHDIAMEMLKSIAESHATLTSMLKPIADSQSTILELMEKFHINLHNVKGGLTEFSYKLTQAAERDKTLLIAIESDAEYTRRYISHKENIGVKEAGEKYSEIVRENRRLTESGS